MKIFGYLHVLEWLLKHGLNYIDYDVLLRPIEYDDDNLWLAAWKTWKINKSIEKISSSYSNGVECNTHFEKNSNNKK